MQVQEVIHNIETLPRLHEKNDLSYIKKVLAFLDNPQDKVKTIHITGTNGKGSTSYYLSNLIKKAGCKTGLFVSPYVERFNERIQLNNEQISDSDLIKGYNAISNAVTELKKADPKFNLVTFEFETALAFWYFSYKKCDYAVIEVGIGGQHDKTNVITPEVSIITTVGLDHEKIIGPTIEDIAREKSGVIKPHVPVVLGNVPDSVLDILVDKAKKESAPVYLLDKDFVVSDQENIGYQDQDEKMIFDKRPRSESYDLAVAYRAFKLLHLSLSPKKVQEALNNTQIPGRFDVIQKKPLIILDGAHNIQAITQLLNYVHELPAKKYKFLVGMMKDKDLKEVLALFNPQDQLYLTRIDYPRAAKWEDFKDAIKQKAIYDEDYKKLFDQLVNELQDDEVLVVTGSFYLVGALLNYWRHR
ncbi:bifunctional folylpolyglutamate synthase/dihydrofolate synthase [Lactobacillus hominis]|uniref:bifunctional folylpolyglutamate synthase/dihydrofolate synthase n=1 Tax=Lactobacillus hominis TaxID=1203033 RepID=UPI0023F2F31D|nr:folylpolyglutamate synthase/dihydrofolate synthase family protein [Lactobacillus hominis]